MLLRRVLGNLRALIQASTAAILSLNLVALSSNASSRQLDGLHLLLFGACSRLGRLLSMPMHAEAMPCRCLMRQMRLWSHEPTWCPA